MTKEQDQTPPEEDDFEIFLRWYKENERRFHTGQFDIDEIAFSAWLAGRKYQQGQAQPQDNSDH